MSLPKFRSYTLCNLRGGIGKTSLSFNLSYLGDDVLAVDTCPQGNLSFFFDEQYYHRNGCTVKDLILSYLIPGLRRASHVATFVGATNRFFAHKKTYYITENSIPPLWFRLSLAFSKAGTRTADTTCIFECLTPVPR